MLEPSLQQLLWPWLERWLPNTDSDEGSYAALDLDGYAAASRIFGDSDGERQRLLAVFLQEQWAITDWKVLGRIYDAAQASSPGDPLIHASRALGALWVEEVSPTPEGSLWDDAVKSARTATELAPDDAYCWGILVEVLYMSPKRSPLEVLDACARAIALDPLNPWPRLFRAHCLHDDARWHEAAQAYADVNVDSFGDLKKWRAFLAQEQRAHCLMMAGRTQEAIAAFVQVIEDREKALKSEDGPDNAPALHERPVLLAHAARTQLRDELYSRVFDLLRREGADDLLAAKPGDFQP